MAQAVEPSAGTSSPSHQYGILNAVNEAQNELWNDFRDVFCPEDLQILFPDTDDPDCGLGHFSECCNNIQEWADGSLNLTSADDCTISTAIDEQMEMIYSVPIKLVGNMMQVSEAIKSNAQQSFDVLPYSNYYMLKFADGGIFAQVCESVSRGFEALKDYSSVEMKATVDMDSVKGILARAKRPGEAISTACITVYGSRDESTAVGNALSSSKVFLQDPEEASETVCYLNPQEARFPGMEEPVSAVPDRFRIAMPSTKSHRNELESETLSEAINTIYRSLKRFRVQDQQKGSARVLTDLLHHQQIALHFMVQREFGPVPESFSFWHVDQDTQPMKYKHKITEICTGHRPSEEGGGILADDMGMGKTLTTLALIEATSGDAASWATQPEAGINHHRDLPRTKATLIIVPSTLIMNSWTKQIKTHIERSFKSVIYYGKERDTKADSYLDSDVVFTTYHTVAASINVQNNLIYSFQWFRIILDEGEYQTPNAHDPKATNDFVPSSMPTLRQIQVVPDWNSYSKSARRLFHKYVILPFEEDREEACRKFAFLLDCVCLRRPQTLLYLPKTVETVHYIDLSPSEQNQYRTTMDVMSRMLQKKAGQGPGKRSTFGLFQAQLHLRLLCNHGTFQKGIRDATARDIQAESEDAIYSLGRQADNACLICGIQLPIFATLGRSVTTQFKCTHRVCQDCGVHGALMHKFTASQCQICGAEAIAGGKVQPVETSIDMHRQSSKSETYFHATGFSSKMEALMNDLDRHRGSGKCIVFSSWTRSLDLIVIHLERLKIPFIRIDGTQSSSQRQYSLDRFTSYQWIPVLLMTTGVGAVGLNLTVANRVYIVEPQWNPSIESQAIGRISRIGQDRTVHVTRYLIRGTVEMKMHSQQIRKIELAKIGLKS